MSAQRRCALALVCTAAALLAVVLLSGEEDPTGSLVEHVEASKHVVSKRQRGILRALRQLKSYAIVARPKALRFQRAHGTLSSSVMAQLIISFGSLPKGCKRVTAGGLLCSKKGGFNIVTEYARVLGDLKEKYKKGLNSYLLNHLDKAILSTKRVVVLQKGVGYSSGTFAVLSHSLLGLDKRPDYFGKLAVRLRPFWAVKENVRHLSKGSEAEAAALWLAKGKKGVYLSALAQEKKAWKAKIAKRARLVREAALDGETRAFDAAKKRGAKFGTNGLVHPEPPAGLKAARWCLSHPVDCLVRRRRSMKKVAFPKVERQTLPPKAHAKAAKVFATVPTKKRPKRITMPPRKNLKKEAKQTAKRWAAYAKTKENIVTVIKNTEVRAEKKIEKKKAKKVLKKMKKKVAKKPKKKKGKKKGKKKKKSKTVVAHYKGPYYLRYRKKWPHCRNIGNCVSGSVKDFKKLCNRHKYCTGFSYPRAHKGARGCLKACGRKEFGGFGHKSHSYYKRGSPPKIKKKRTPGFISLSYTTGKLKHSTSRQSPSVVVRGYHGKVEGKLKLPSGPGQSATTKLRLRKSLGRIMSVKLKASSTDGWFFTRFLVNGESFGCTGQWLDGKPYDKAYGSYLHKDNVELTRVPPQEVRECVQFRLGARGNEGEDNCPKGFTRVMSETECKSWAVTSTIGKKWRGKGCYHQMTPGCFENGYTIAFNTCKKATSRWNHAPVCKN